MRWLRPGEAATLDEWRSRGWSPGSEAGPGRWDSQDSYTAEVGREPTGEPETDGPFRRCAATILRYEIFPSTLVSGVLARSPVQTGDTVGIRFHGFGLFDLFFAARVLSTFEHRDDSGVWRAGFRYRTLDGHPELGEETFEVEKHPDGRVVVALRSWSRPGLWLTWLGYPVTRYFQRYASYAALRNLSAVAAGPRPIIAAPTATR